MEAARNKVEFNIRWRGLDDSVFGVQHTDRSLAGVYQAPAKLFSGQPGRGSKACLFGIPLQQCTWPRIALTLQKYPYAIFIGNRAAG